MMMMEKKEREKKQTNKQNNNKLESDQNDQNDDDEFQHFLNSTVTNYKSVFVYLLDDNIIINNITEQFFIQLCYFIYY